MKYHRTIFVVFIVLIFYWVFRYFGLFDVPKLKTGDLFFRLKYEIACNPRLVSDIVIVSIGDSTYAGRWPWDRDVFADLVYKLMRYKPSVIGFDLGFIEAGTRSSASDYLFREAIKDSGNVVLASYIDKEGKYILPQDDFRKVALGYGFTNKPEDLDNVIRETRLFTRYDLTGEIMDYSFDLKIACAFLGFTFDDNGREIVCGKLKAPYSEGKGFFTNYNARFSDFVSVPIEDVVEKKIPLDFIKDKIVLIGVTDEIFHDISFTPLGKMPGVVIIANNVSMLINGNFLYRIPRWLDITVLFIFGLLATIAILRGQVYKVLLLVLTVFVLFIGVSIALIVNDVLWDFFSVPLVIASIFILNTTVNYTELLMQSFRIKRAVTMDFFTGLPTRRYFLLRLDRELRWMKQRGDMALVYFSIDNVSGILEELGANKLGDIIKQIASEIIRCSRKTRGVDFIARYGETEFCSVLHGAGKEGALRYSDRIRKSISKEISAVSYLTISVGIADINDIETKLAKFFVKCAETALVRARHEGVGKVCVYDPKIDYIDVGVYEKEKEFSEVDLSYAASEFEEKNKELAILVNKVRIAHEDVIKSEKLSAMGKVAATIHHDISKPIFNLKSSLGMIKGDIDKIDLSELVTAKKLLGSAVEETERLSKLCDSLKDLYRPVKKEVSKLTINPILEEMLGLSRVQMEKNRILLIKNLDPNLPSVSADPGELKQVFLNLIINAIESMKNGGTLEVRSTVSKEKENMVEVMVKDTGYGISPEDMNKLFKAFFTTKKLEHGAGLGLYASSEIVKRYGGKITVESKPGEGSVFKVYLPYK